MMDYRIITPKLEKLQEYVTYLKGYQKHRLEDVKKDHTLQGAILHYLQLAIECVLDIGEMLISGLRLKKPEQVREVLIILAENNIIPKDFAKNFSPIAGLRNILVHDYVDVDMDKVYGYLKNKLVDFDLYARKIAQYIKK
jgi:uncharacterized protein YutE (UPF0331/DUF86 family)